MSKLIATIPATPKGIPQVNKKALERLDWFGKLLLDYRAKREEMKFINALLDNQQDGKIHVSIKTPGTITGRCSAGKIGG